MFNLKEYRQDVLKVSQEDLARMLNMVIEDIIKLEESKEINDVSFLIKLARATGDSLEDLVGYKNQAPEALQVNNTWKTPSLFKEVMLEYIKNRKSDLQLDNNTKYQKMIKELESLIYSTIVKPKVAIVGMSDAGKSKLINSLLGKEKMPTSWTPTTSISVHIKHINDRPDFMKEDEAWIFKAEKAGFDTKKFNDNEYCKQRKIAGGDASILAKYGTRQGDKYNIEDVSAAVVYLDSSILQVCDIVDLPGFGTGDRKNDDILAQKSREFADIVIYLSIANGFLRGTDIEFLKSTLNSLPVIENKQNKLDSLNNLFIVASQAHTVNKGSKEDLDNILKAGAERLFNEVPEEIWGNREEQSGSVHTIDDLKKRFFTYTTDKPYLRESFEEELKQLLETLPAIINKNAKNSVEQYIQAQEQFLRKEVEQYMEIIKEREEYKKIFEQRKKNEPIREKENQKARKEVGEKVKRLHLETVREFESEFNSIISVDNIVETIRLKKYKKKKEDMELLAGFLSSKLQGKLQNILKDKSKELNKIIDEYLENFNIQINRFDNLQLKTFEIPFDSAKVFASGLAGLATFGGLAIWASTLGNLGAYILVAKGVSVLSALGISIAGGTAGAASAVAALGGPVTLGIALAVIVGLSVFTFMSGGWQKSVAKKIVAQYSKQGAFEQFVGEINKFWNDTEVGFNVAADYLDEEWKKNLAELDNMISSFSDEEIQQNINEANNLKEFLKNVPLSELITI
ncbi:dynamin family protein [Bacillus sp. JJ634]